MRKSGETNPVTYLIFAAIAAGAFYAFHVGPVYWGNLEAKEAAAQAFNIYILKGESNAREELMMRLNGRNTDVTHYEVDDDGVESEKPGYGLTEDNITFTFDERTRKLTVRIAYDRVVEFKPLKKRKTYRLVAEKTGTFK